MDIIGFGGAGCNVAKTFEVYSQYKIHYIGVGLRGADSYSLLKANTMEEAETNVPKFSKLIKKLKNEVVFICAGSGINSGSILGTLEQFKHLPITVIYIKPDYDLLSEKEKQRERVAHGVLQQFARSGLLKRMYLFDNAKIAEILGGLSIVEYHSKINQMIGNSLHMLNYFKNADSIMTNISDPQEINRISTVGVYNFEEEAEKYFYDIVHVREKHFYFAFNDETLNKEKNLLNKISGQIKNAGQSEYTAVSYDITATTYEENFAYIEAHTNFIQGEKNS
jgi:hypothetical protein